MTDEGHLRASDADRDRVSLQLRAHWTEGRIDAEELERRLAGAVSAQTVDDLAGLVADLPAARLPASSPARPSPPPLGPPGLRPFTQRIEVPASADRVRDLALDAIAVGLNRLGYDLVHQSPAGLAFRRAHNEWVRIDIEPRSPTQTMMVVHGRASRRVRKQFAALRFDA